jgi:hypothetical protein
MAEADVALGGKYGDDNHLRRPCMVVKGRYKPIGATSFNASSFYRVDFITSSRQLHDILRNHNYQVVITAVSGPGKNSVAEALETVSSELKTRSLPTS